MGLTLDEFKKLELRVAKILDVEEIPGADRIWKLRIDTGSGEKQIVAGIKQDYTRENLLGKSVIVINNLVPSVIRGVESQGMLLAAKYDGHLSILSPDKELPPGSTVG